MWSNVVKGLKEDELETTNSDEIGNGSKTVDPIERSDMIEMDHKKSKQTRMQPKQTMIQRSRQIKGHECRESKGANKGLLKDL